jgi:hypothetical protein
MSRRTRWIPLDQWLAYKLFGDDHMAVDRNVATTKAERKTAAAQRLAPNLRTINSADVRVLAKLDDARRVGGMREAWLLPREIGGAMHSQHANILVKLARHGLVERSWVTVGRPGRQGYRLHNRITTKGVRVLAAVRKVDES